MKLGAVRGRGSATLTLPKDVVKRLKAEIRRWREQTQGRQSADAASSPQVVENSFLALEQRDADISLERRELCTRETQPGSYQLEKNRRSKDCLSPTPFHSHDWTPEKNLPTRGEDLKRERDLFVGVMDDMRKHLLNPGRPQIAYLEGGENDWRLLTFDSFKLETALWHGSRVNLMISSADAKAARNGLQKYQRKWMELTRKWFLCEVATVVKE
jgi:hypothetical protein